VCSFILLLVLLLLLFIVIMVVSSAIRFISKEVISAVEVVAIEAEMLKAKDKKAALPHRKQREKLIARVYDTFGGLELALSSDTDDSTDEELSSNEDDAKTVQFADPLVTKSWVVPRIAKDDKQLMFYSRRDIAKFRRDRRNKFGKDKQYDRDFCEKLLEKLDKLGYSNYAKGDFTKALEAFNHALRVRSQTHVDFNQKTTCKNIHCIADIYSKQRDWRHALEAYRAALYAIRSCHDDDAKKTIIGLERKVALVEKQVEFLANRRLVNV